MDTPKRNQLWSAKSGRVVIVDDIKGGWVWYHQVEPAANIEEMMQTARPIENFLSVYQPPHNQEETQS